LIIFNGFFETITIISGQLGPENDAERNRGQSTAVKGLHDKRFFGSKFTRGIFSKNFFSDKGKRPELVKGQ
jgi:hypothetical protein